MCLKVVANPQAGGRNLVVALTCEIQAVFVVLQLGRHGGAEFKSVGVRKGAAWCFGATGFSMEGLSKMCWIKP